MSNLTAPAAQDVNVRTPDGEDLRVHIGAGTTGPYVSLRLADGSALGVHTAALTGEQTRDVRLEVGQVLTCNPFT